MKDNIFYGSKDWRDILSNTSQIGGIETSVLDNGLSRGVRVADFNTGAGLRFKLVLDRGMDIADSFYGNYCLAWISRNGICQNANSTLQGFDWLNRFGGGLLTTCGMSHVGGPETQFGLHDRFSNLPAEIESIVQPNPLEDKYEMSVTGRILQSTVFGPHLQMRRTVSSKLGENKIRIRDTVKNIGNTACPLMLLYHINLGWPLIDAGTKLDWKGKWSCPNPDDKIINAQRDFKECLAPTSEHSGNKESLAFIDIEPEQDGYCRCGAVNERLGFGLRITFPKKSLPWLINWQHFGKNEYVCALEPATNPPIGQTNAKNNGSLNILEAGESKEFSVDCEVFDL